MSILLPTTEITDLIENQPAWFEQQILAACCKSVAFFDQFKAVLNVHPADPKMRQEDFSLPQDNHIYTLLTRYRTFMAGSKGTDILPPEFAQKALGAMTSVGELLPEQADMAWRRLHDVMATPVEGVMQLVHDGIPHWLSKRRVRKVAMEMANSEIWKPDELVKDINIALNSAANANQENYTFDFSDGYLAKAPDIERLSSGLPRFDEAIGGGFGFGEFHLGIAATGAGKTVFATQMAAWFASNGEPGIFISTEQAHGDLQARIFSNMCNIPFEVIKDGVHRDKLPPDLLARTDAMNERLRGKFLFLDWCQDHSKSVTQDLEAEVLRYLEKNGRKPRWMIFDWIGGALGALLKLDAGAYRILYNITADKLAEIARKHDMVVIALAQANNVQAKNNPKIDSTCIAECKSLGRAATNIFGISSLQENSDTTDAPYSDRQFIYVSKARKGPGAHVRVRRNFAFQRFSPWK